MENVYTAYAKAINGTTFYFVKSFSVFPEYKNVPPLLRSYGMHRRFEKACSIASVFDRHVRQQLLQEMEMNAASAALLPLFPPAAEKYRLERSSLVPEFRWPQLGKLLRPLVLQFTFHRHVAGQAIRAKASHRSVL